MPTGEQLETARSHARQHQHDDQMLTGYCVSAAHNVPAVWPCPQIDWARRILAAGA